eukprot:TRINITY_DN93406_c0_g1_i1.p1 TRINITY_DN93406_c0_g1~~TRINITY_DN93406_c0_g1_i1.p1  ORF type:complete len:258 (+),score=23.52 TRINITY_DN93406_c0_g1_i1:61-774(+)
MATMRSVLCCLLFIPLGCLGVRSRSGGGEEGRVNATFLSDVILTGPESVQISDLWIQKAHPLFGLLSSNSQETLDGLYSCNGADTRSYHVYRTRMGDIVTTPLLKLMGEPLYLLYNGPAEMIGDELWPHGTPGRHVIYKMEHNKYLRPVAAYDGEFWMRFKYGEKGSIRQKEPSGTVKLFVPDGAEIGGKNTARHCPVVATRFCWSFDPDEQESDEWRQSLSVDKLCDKVPLLPQHW